MTALRAITRTGTGLATALLLVATALPTGAALDHAPPEPPVCATDPCPVVDCGVHQQTASQHGACTVAGAGAAWDVAACPDFLVCLDDPWFSCRVTWPGAPPYCGTGA